MNKSKSLLLSAMLAMLLIGPLVGKAQQTLVNTDPSALYGFGLELFKKNQFNAARKQLSKLDQEKFGNEKTEAESALRANADYYKALSAVYLKEEDAPQLLNRFVSMYPDHPNATHAKYQLGLNYFSDKQYKESIKWLQSADPQQLTPEDKSARMFYLGYAYLKEGQKPLALSTFKRIANYNDDYAIAANYYIGWLSTEMGRYTQALTAFKKVENTRKYSKVVPLHIAQIYVAQGKYDELLAYAEPMVNDPHIKDKSEINKLVGQTYYEQGNYEKALPYLQGFVKYAKERSPDDYYSLGYAAHQTGDYKQAIDAFKFVANEKSSLGQNASYLMADSHLKKREKREARTAFKSASKMPYDKELQELSSFNYAQLSYELNMQSEALNALQDFVKKYPNSEHASSARRILGNVLLSSRNYKQALIILDGIEPKTNDIREIQQKVSLYRGQELQLAGSYADAIDMYNIAIKNDLDKPTQTQAYFWKGEALYAMKNYDGARYIHGLFQKNYSPSSEIPTDVHPAASYYTTAYCYYNSENYKSAASSFENVVSELNNSSSAVSRSEYLRGLREDATLRSGDVNFTLNNYGKSRTYYDKAIRSGYKSADYATFQKGILQGLEKNSTGKLATFKELTRKYPKSAYVDDAYYQIAQHYFLRAKYSDALVELGNLINKYPNSVLVPRAKNTQALIYFNQGNLSKALSAYKNVAESYPRTQDGRDALAGIKDIYVAQGDVDGYFSYIKKNKNKFGDVDSGNEDELTFQAAESFYTKGDCKGAQSKLVQYLSKYPTGLYVANALYLKGDCLFASGDKDKAMFDFEKVADMPKNLYTERSIRRAAELRYGRGDYNKALELFESLRRVADGDANKKLANLGIMRAAYKTGDLSSAETAASTLLNSSGLEDEIKREANLIRGNVAIGRGDLNAAALAYAKVNTGPKDEFTAEAMYGLALIDFKNGSYTASQDQIFKLIKEVPYFDYWIAKSFILLSDNYVKEDNLFQARATLESILDTYKGEDLLVIARKKIKEIDALENKSGE